MYTLVVVDMQPKFTAANHDEVGKNCLREVRKAVEDKADIVFLEFSGWGDTLPSLKMVVEDYERAKFIRKRRDDGSEQVQEVVTEHNFMITRFRVVGINTDYCVYSTVSGLRERFPNSVIEVVADACDSDDDHWNGLVNIRKIPQVDILHAP